MKKFFILMLSAILANCSFNFTLVPQTVNSNSDVFDIKQAHKSVASVFVKAKKSDGQMSGTAFAIDDDHMVTAGHVCVAIVELQDADVIENVINLAIVKDGNKYVESGVEILEIDEPNDACLIKKKDHGLIPLEFVKDYNKDVKFGDKVWIVGAPLGYMISWQEGHIMDVNVNDKKIPLRNKLIVSAAAASGNSGSPVLNEQGKVVGILVMGHTQFDHLSICTRSPIVQRFLQLSGWPK